MAENAKALFDQIKKQGSKRIQAIIDENDLEHWMIDYKEKSKGHGEGETRKIDAEPWTLAADDKKNYSKALSGFANGGGGIILWESGRERRQMGKNISRLNRSNPCVDL
ncbi:MAG: hypothetical protein O3A46_01435 [Candidatus Poribacteria bacterium]|nr:hypothetical protein [Candidatus Poribacteria bacterium]